LDSLAKILRVQAQLAATLHLLLSVTLKSHPWPGLPDEAGAPAIAGLIAASRRTSSTGIVLRKGRIARCGLAN
jgi:hypothetical protein